MPKRTPILFTRERCSLNKTTPTNVMITRFNTVNTEIALDKYSYFNENAQNTVPMKYRNKPKTNNKFLFSNDHFLNKTSAMTSRRTAKIKNNQNPYFNRTISWQIKWIIKIFS